MIITSTVKITRVNDVSRIVAFIPSEHHHVRLMIEFSDGAKLFLQQAVIDAIIRAYAAVALHPTRKAIEFVLRQIPSKKRKMGFAKWQLIESGKEETLVLREMSKFYFMNDETRASDK